MPKPFDVDETFEIDSITQAIACLAHYARALGNVTGNIIELEGLVKKLLVAYASDNRWAEVHAVVQELEEFMKPPAVFLRRVRGFPGTPEDYASAFNNYQPPAKKETPSGVDVQKP